MPETKQATSTINVEQSITDILSTIEREREREIIARRFGLFDRKETLEQIGEMLGITRERVRQLEKSVLTRLRTAAEQGSLPGLLECQTAFISSLHTMGEAGRISDLAARLGD